MTLKRGKIKDYWYGILCRLLSDGLSTDPPQLKPDPCVLLTDPMSLPFSPPGQWARWCWRGAGAWPGSGGAAAA